VELEHLEIETRLIDEIFRGYCHILVSASTRKPRGGSGNTHDQIALTELLKLAKSGQFPDETVRIGKLRWEPWYQGTRAPQPWALVPGHFFIFIFIETWMSHFQVSQDLDESLSSLSRLG
jgi:hypothetical protein